MTTTTEPKTYAGTIHLTVGREHMYAITIDLYGKVHPHSETVVRIELDAENKRKFSKAISTQGCGYGEMGGAQGIYQIDPDVLISSSAVDQDICDMVGAF